MSENKKAGTKKSATKSKSLQQKVLAVQTSMESLSKEKSNEFTNSKYFDINDVLKNLQPLLAAHNLLVTQPLVIVDGAQILRTVVHDCDSGDEDVTEMLMPVDSNPQKIGSAVTYYRRYSLQSYFGMQAADDDGNSASKPNKPAKPADTDPVIKDALAKLEAAKNLKELGSAWASFSGTQKANKTVLNTKNKLKAKFQS